MNWVCAVCGEKGTSGDIEAAMVRHRLRSPGCPADEKPRISLARGSVVIFSALDELQARTWERIVRGVEGRHAH